MSLIKTVGLTKKRGTQAVLNQVDLSVNEGDFVAIMGKSGAGKSTLLYILGGIETADEGEVIFNDKTLTGLSENALSDIRRKHFGFVFQNYNLIDEMTVEENLLLLKYYDKKVGAGTKEKLVEYAERFDILKCLKKYPGQLSGGEKQRVAIVRTLLSDSEVIFADEPTGALDSVNCKVVMEALKQVNEKEGKTIVMVTHDADVAGYAGSVIRIADGKVIYDK